MQIVETVAPSLFSGDDGRMNSTSPTEQRGTGNTSRRGAGAIALRIVACTLAALGLWLSVDLWRIGGGAKATNPLLAAQCDPTSTSDSTTSSAPANATTGGGESKVDCGSVLASQWGSVPLSPQPGSPRIPMAAIGVGYFIALLAWLAFVGPPSRAYRGWAAVFLLVLFVGVWQSLELTLVMANQLKTWCVGCAAVHLVNGAILLLSLAVFPWRGGGSDGRATQALPLASATAAALGFLLTMALALANAHAGTLTALNREYLRIVNDPEYARWDFARQPRVEISLSDNSPAIGPEDAPHTLVMFGDLQCPMCRIAHETARAAQQRWPGKLRFIFRHYPLDRSCNTTSARTMHPAACAAARGLEAATQLGGVAARERMLDLVYQRNERLANAPWTAWAGEAGLDAAAFAGALRDDRCAVNIARDIALADKLGIRATPVLYLDEREFNAWRNIEVWGALLE